MEKRDEIAESLKDFGRNLRKVRMARKLTLEIVAERADLNIRTLQRFEAGTSNVLLTTVIRLQRAIGCSWNELMSGKRA